MQWLEPMTKKPRAKNRSARKPDKYAKLKLALIPVLLCVLLYVVFGGGKEVPQAVAAQATDVAANVYTTAPVDTNSGTEEVANSEIASGEGLSGEGLSGRTSSGKSPGASIDQWPDGDLEFLVHSNPFASYRVDASAAATSNASDPERKVVDTASPSFSEEIKQLIANKPVQYVFRSENRKLVMLGGELLEEGDSVSSRGRIDDIQPGHLVLIRDPSRHNKNPTDSVQ